MNKEINVENGVFRPVPCKRSNYRFGIVYANGSCWFSEIYGNFEQCYEDYCAWAVVVPEDELLRCKSRGVYNLEQVALLVLAGDYYNGLVYVEQRE